jgi:valyl-tRNA synthetase
MEKMLLKSEGKSRHDLGREEVVEKVWEWRHDYDTHITTQTGAYSQLLGRDDSRLCDR